ncbi:MAG: hypothetical protein V3V14_10050, partial [Saprospiraceae bacterium]
MKYLFTILLLYGFYTIESQSIEQITKAKPFELSGSIGGNLGLYGVNGIDQRTSPFQYGLSARINFKIYSFSIPIYASIRDNSFNY